MSYHFLDDKDPRIDVMFQGLEKMEKMLSVIEKMPKSLFNGERGTLQSPAGKQAHIAGVPDIRGGSLLHGAGQDSV